MAIGFMLGSLFSYGLRLWADEQATREIERAAQLGLPAPDGPAVKPLNSIVVRVDSVQFMQDVGDDDGAGELSFHTLAVRQRGNTAKLSYPNEGNPLEIYPRQVVALNQFSLQIEDIHPDEPIEVYFLALDEDRAASIEQTVATEVVMDIVVESLVVLLSEGVQLPYANLTGFFLDRSFGNVAAWWEEADFIGVYRVRIDPNDYQRIDRAYDELSIEGNMRLKFAVLSGYTTRDVPVTREVEITRLVEATRQVPVTRQVEVTREVVVERVIGPMTEVTRVVPILQPVACSAPTAQQLRCPTDTAVTVLQAVQPTYGEYQNPIVFRWNGSLLTTYKVQLVHLESGVRHESDWIQDVRWEYHIPKEEFGNWQWQVVDAYGRQSAQGVFVFNPHPRPGGR